MKKIGHKRVGDPSAKYRLRMILLAVALVVAAAASLCIGRYVVPLGDVPFILYGIFATWINDVCTWWAALATNMTTWFSGDVSAVRPPSVEVLPVPDIADTQAWISIANVRLPRVLMAMLVGAALSVAGAAYQGMFQNPMASQDVLGASSGAAFGAALGIFLGLGTLAISAAAFAFGLAAVVASYGISKVSRSNAILSMVLAGMVVSALFSSGTSFLKLVADTEDALPAITYWLMGSLASVRANEVLPTALLVLLAGMPLFLLRWRINLLATGEEEARSMGLSATKLRLVVIVCATFLTATCVSVSGLIGWVGLVIPHFCRLLLGSDYRRIIPACILMGALFLLVVDDFARLITTSEIPIGILTSFIGAPVFIWLIAKGGGRGCFSK